MGLYVVFEGIDGAGKTTQAELLRDYFSSQGYSVFLFHEPTTTKAGRIVKEMIRDNTIYGKDAIALAFALDRIMYKYETLESVLKKYDLIIGDRSFYSSIVYQKVMGLDLGWLRELNKYVIVPDIAFVLEISIEEQMRRRGESNIIFEKKEFQKKLIEEYKKLREYFPNSNFIYVNGEDTIERIHLKLREIVWEKLR